MSSDSSDEELRIPLSREDVEAFRAWQREQLRKIAAANAEQRQPWETDPDAWKGE